MSKSQEVSLKVNIVCLQALAAVNSFSRAENVLGGIWVALAAVNAIDPIITICRKNK